jgi:amino acid transporter
MLVGALSGIEYIAILAGESRQPEKSIGRSVWISSPVICGMFILGTSSVLAFHPHGNIDFIAPIPQTLRIALGATGIGNVFAITAIVLLQLRLIGAASYAFTGVTRLPMTVGWDRLIPNWFTQLHPTWRTPANSILCTAAVVMLLVVMAGLGVHAQEAFQVLTNASITHYELAYLAMFAIPITGSAVLRRQLPSWLKWLAAAYPFVDVVNPRAYAAKILGTTFCSNCAGLLFYKLRGRKSVSAASRNGH